MIQDEADERHGKFLKCKFINEDNEENEEITFQDMDKNIELFSKVDIVSTMYGYLLSGNMGITLKPMFVKVYPPEEDDEDLFSSNKHSGDELSGDQKKARYS